MWFDYYITVEPRLTVTSLLRPLFLSPSSLDWTLLWSRSLRGSMILRVVLGGAHTPGRFNHFREVLSESPDKNRPAVSCSAISGWSEDQQPHP